MHESFMRVIVSGGSLDGPARSRIAEVPFGERKLIPPHRLQFVFQTTHCFQAGDQSNQVDAHVPYVEILRSKALAARMPDTQAQEQSDEAIVRAVAGEYGVTTVFLESRFAPVCACNLRSAAIA